MKALSKQLIALRDRSSVLRVTQTVKQRRRIGKTRLFEGNEQSLEIAPRLFTQNRIDEAGAVGLVDLSLGRKVGAAWSININSKTNLNGLFARDAWGALIDIACDCTAFIRAEAGINWSFASAEWVVTDGMTVWNDGSDILFQPVALPHFDAGAFRLIFPLKGPGTIVYTRPGQVHQGMHQTKIGGGLLFKGLGDSESMSLGGNRLVEPAIHRSPINGGDRSYVVVTIK